MSSILSRLFEESRSVKHALREQTQFLNKLTDSRAWTYALYESAQNIASREAFLKDHFVLQKQMEAVSRVVSETIVRESTLRRARSEQYRELSRSGKRLKRWIRAKRAEEPESERERRAQTTELREMTQYDKSRIST